MKRCSFCKKTKSFDGFHRRGKSYQNRCIECRKKTDKVFYDKNKKKIYAQKTERGKELLKWHRELKSKIPCTDCKKRFHPVAMQWDHLPQFEKGYAISVMVSDGFSKESIMDEIKKCELVCANCHAVRTHKRFLEE